MHHNVVTPVKRRRRKRGNPVEIAPEEKVPVAPEDEPMVVERFTLAPTVTAETLIALVLRSWGGLEGNPVRRCFAHDGVIQLIRKDLELLHAQSYDIIRRKFPILVQDDAVVTWQRSERADGNAAGTLVWLLQHPRQGVFFSLPSDDERLVARRCHEPFSDGYFSGFFRQGVLRDLPLGRTTSELQTHSTALAFRTRR